MVSAVHKSTFGGQYELKKRKCMHVDWTDAVSTSYLTN